MTHDDRIVLEDTTLRDGEQAPGVAWSKEQKLSVLEALLDANVGSIEVGIPKMGGEELEFLKFAVAYKDQARLVAWNRGVKEDVAQSLDLGYEAVHIGLPTSDIHIKSSVGKSRDWIVSRATELIKFVKDRGAFVSISAEDVGRTDVSFLQDYAGAVGEAGADRLRLSDTVGILHPEIYADRVRLVAKTTNTDLQCHCHNDFGLAVANTIAGLQAGARYFHVCINGIGERAGMPDIAQTVMALKKLYGIDVGVDTKKLRDLSELVFSLTNTSPEPWRPIVGRNVFAHESGIHSKGTLNDSTSFEPISPDEVNGTRRIVIGKHSGRAGLTEVLRNGGVDPEESLLPKLLENVRAESVRQGGELSPLKVKQLYSALSRSQTVEAAE